MEDQDYAAHTLYVPNIVEMHVDFVLWEEFETRETLIYR